MDRNIEKLSKTAEKIENPYKMKVKSISADLANEQAVMDLIASINAVDIDLFIHCAMSRK